MRIKLKKIIAAAVVVSTGAAFFTSPMFSAAKLALSYTDPLSITEFRLRGLSREAYVAKIDEALAEGDFDDARTIAAIAKEERHSLDPSLLARLNAGLSARSAAFAYDFGVGFVFGDAASTAQISGALTSDLIGVGDARDLLKEGGKAISGAEVDWITLSLAAFGIGTSVMTATSMGLTAPLDIGAAILKTANKSKRITAGLRRHLSAVALTAIDLDALKIALKGNPAALVRMPGIAVVRQLYGAMPGTGASHQELLSFRTFAADLVPVNTAVLRSRFGPVLRPGAADAIATFSTSTAATARNGGIRAAFRTLSVSEDPQDLAKFSRLSEKAGARTSPIVRLLGRGAIHAGDLVYKVLSSIAVLIIWIVSGVWTVATLIAGLRILMRA